MCHKTNSTQACRPSWRTYTGKNGRRYRRFLQMLNKTKAVFLGLALTLTVKSMDRDEYTRNFDKTFTLRQGQALRVDHSMGEIVIHTHPQLDLTIHAEIHVSASDRGRA